MVSTKVIIMLGIIATIIIFVANAWREEQSVQPEIYYKLAPPTSIFFGEDRIGSINAEVKNIGETTATAVVYLKGDNVTFVTDENKSFLWTDEGDIFYHCTLTKNMESYWMIPTDSTFQFYIGENVSSFNITIGIEIKKSTSWFKLCDLHLVYPITVEYIQTGPSSFSLK